MAEPAPSAAAGAAPDEGRPTAAARWSRGAAFVVAGLFLLLAGVQIYSVFAGPNVDAERTAILATPFDPAVARWVLSDPADAAAPPRAVAYLDARRNRILVGGRGLPEVGKDERYVLWALDRADGGLRPRNLASFAGGGPILDVFVRDAPGPSDLKGLAVSVEKDANATAPGRLVAQGGP